MEKSVITISNITDFIETVCKLNNEVQKELSFHYHTLLFRGQSDKDFELIPSIGRNRSGACDCTIFNEERNLIDMAKFKMPNVFRNDLSPIELLALLQHHGIPTRLLDISENALVALYFACCDNQEKDGEVIVFKSNDDDVTNYPIINAIADSCRFTNGTWTPLSFFYGDVKNQPYFLEQKRTMEVSNEDDIAGGEWISNCCHGIMYIYAPIQSARQQAQQGRYILFPNHIEYETYNEGSFEWTMDAIPKDHEDIALRIIIPKEIKKQLLLDLSILGITEATLFCDSIDTVCKGIVESFQKKCKKMEAWPNE